MADCIECGDGYLTPEEVLKEILCGVETIAGNSNIIEIETSTINKKVCLVSDPSIEVAVEVIRNEDNSFNKYVFHYLDGSGTMVDPANLADITVCDDEGVSLLQQILDRLNTDCTNPIKVEVCNLTNIETTLSGILTAVQAIDANTDTVEASLSSIIAELIQNTADNSTIITSLSSVISELQTIDANTDQLETLVSAVSVAIVAEGDQTQGLLTTVNTTLVSILNRLNTDCTNPLKVEVCNQLDLSTIESSLSTIISELVSANSSLSTLVSNTDTIEAQLTTLSNQLTSIQTDIQVGNTTLSSINTALSTTNTTLASILTEVQSIDENTDEVEGLLNTVLTELNDTQTILQNEFDETQVLITATNTKLDTLIAKLNESCAGSPINVNVCNQIDLTTLEGKLDTVISLITTSNTLLSAIDGNTDEVEARLADILLELGDIETAIANNSTQLANILSRLIIMSTQLGGIITELQQIDANVETVITEVQNAVSELQTVQSVLQTEFDESQAIMLDQLDCLSKRWEKVYDNVTVTGVYTYEFSVGGVNLSVPSGTVLEIGDFPAGNTALTIRDNSLFPEDPIESLLIDWGDGVRTSGEASGTFTHDYANVPSATYQGLIIYKHSSGRSDYQDFTITLASGEIVEIVGTNTITNRIYEKTVECLWMEYDNKTDNPTGRLVTVLGAPYTLTGSISACETKAIELANNITTLSSPAYVVSTPRQYQPILGGGQLVVDDTTTYDLTQVVDTITSGTLFGIPADAQGVQLQVVGGDVRYTINGTTPTSGDNGFLVCDKGDIYLGLEPYHDNGCESELSNFQVIAETGSTATINVTYYKVK